jgi:RNA 2',3'-cyclic 3'-phosphodiesterase
MIRLFAGIEIPELHRDRLSMLAAPLPGAKWIDDDDMHITLRFAGDIDNRTAGEFADFLALIDVDPFPIRFTELGAFGGREPRVIYAGVDGGERLDLLQRATDRAARSAGLAPEGRNWHPHVTLARLRGTSSDEVARFLGSFPRLELPPFTVERFVLFSSRPNVGGGPYVVEEAYPLEVRLR